MKKVESCKPDNCIPTPTSCSDWDGGDIDFLGICDGDGLNNVILELVDKVKDVSGDTLSNFDMDSLLDICNQKAPIEITPLSIFNVIKANELCIKDSLENLSEQLTELQNEGIPDVSLKCFNVTDNLGNSLVVTRTALDQIFVDTLCSHKTRIEALEGEVVLLQNEINNIDLNTTVDELSFATCVNGNELPTSTQVINTSLAFCDLQEATGDSDDISIALSFTAGDLNTEFGLISGWNLSPENWAQNYSNLLLEVENLRQRLITIETTCCVSSCDDIGLGFSAVYNEDKTGIIIRFTSGAGTSIPVGFEDKGSTGTITDVDGNIETFVIDIVDNFSGNDTEIIITGLSVLGELDVDITAKIGTDSLVCEKCLHKVVKQSSCGYCELCAEGDEDASVVVIYSSSKSSVVIENSTTSTSTTTTTTGL